MSPIKPSPGTSCNIGPAVDQSFHLKAAQKTSDNRPKLSIRVPSQINHEADQYKVGQAGSEFMEEADSSKGPKILSFDMMEEGVIVKNLSKKSQRRVISFEEGYLLFCNVDVQISKDIKKHSKFLCTYHGPGFTFHQNVTKGSISLADSTAERSGQSKIPFVLLVKYEDFELFFLNANNTHQENCLVDNTVLKDFNVEFEGKWSCEVAYELRSKDLNTPLNKTLSQIFGKPVTNVEYRGHLELCFECQGIRNEYICLLLNKYILLLPKTNNEPDGVLSKYLEVAKSMKHLPFGETVEGSIVSTAGDGGSKVENGSLKIYNPCGMIRLELLLNGSPLIHPSEMFQNIVERKPFAVLRGNVLREQTRNMFFVAKLMEPQKVVITAAVRTVVCVMSVSGENKKKCCLICLDPFRENENNEDVFEYEKTDLEKQV